MFQSPRPWHRSLWPACRHAAAALSLVALAAAGCSPGSGSGAGPTSRAEASANVVPLSFSDLAVESDGGQARFRGLQVAGKPGQPALPTRLVRVLVAPDADLGNVAVTLEGAEERVLPGTYQVSPAQPPRTKDGLRWPPGANIVDGKDMAVYGEDTLFPASNIVTRSSGQLYRFKIVEVTVSPYRWNPVTGELRVITGGQLVVAATPGSAPAIEHPSAALDQRHIARLATLVENFDEAIGAYQAGSVVSSSGIETATGALTAGANGYAILTTEQIRNGSLYLGRFVQSKKDHGFVVKVVTETAAYSWSNGSWIPATGGGWGGGTGNLATERLRAWVRANYVGDNLAYVLLVGDPTPATGSVPMKEVWGDAVTLVPTDMYYAEVSGNWDLDGDGRFGERDDDRGGYDRFAEVSVGRIPYYGVMTHLDHILSKSIAYGNASPSTIAWRKNALLAMKPLDTDTREYVLGELLRTNILVPNGWASTRVYDNNRNGGVSPEVSSCNYDTVSSAWRSTSRGLVVWMGHGVSREATEIMNIERAASLDDTRPSFTFQASCLNATPEDSENLAYTLLRNGAIGTVAATRSGSYAMEPMAPADNVESTARAFTQSLVAGNMSAGDALSAARADCYEAWLNTTEMNLYGDPSLGLTTSGAGATEVPAAPTISSVAQGEGNVVLTWTPVTTASGYSVKRGTSASGPFSPVGKTPPTVTTFKDTSVVNNTQYYYVVTSIAPASGTESANSPSVSARPAATATVQYRVADTNTSNNLIRPYFRVVNAGSTSLALSGITLRYWFTDENPGAWTFTCESGGMSCNVIRGTVGRLSTALTKADSYLEITFLSGAPTIAAGQTSQEIRVSVRHTAAVNFDETNDHSFDPTRTTFGTFRRVTVQRAGAVIWGDVPSPTVTLRYPERWLATEGNGRVSFWWSSVSGATAYNVYRSANGATRTKVGTPTTSMFDDALVTNGTPYDYWVYPVTANGVQVEPGWSTGTLRPRADLPILPPATPTGVAAWAQSGCANVVWDAAAGAGGYYVKRATSPSGPFVVVANPLPDRGSTCVMGMEDGRTYYLTVSAYNAWGEGPSSAPITYVAGQPVTPPGKVTGVTATYQDGMLLLSWNRVAVASEYVLRQSIGGGPVETFRFPASGTGWGTSQVSLGVPYVFTVAAANASGEGPQSDPASITPGGAPSLPEQVTGLAATYLNGEVSLTWNAANGAQEYIIRRSVGGAQPGMLGTSPTTSFTDRDVTSGTYMYVVSGTNAVGEGPWSAAFTVEVPSASEPCSPALDMTGTQSGNFNTTGPVCMRTTANINGWGCSNFAGRTVKVNGVTVACGAMPLPPKVNDDYYYFDVSAGTYPYASFYLW